MKPKQLDIKNTNRLCDELSSSLQIQLNQNILLSHSVVFNYLLEKDSTIRKLTFELAPALRWRLSYDVVQL